MARKGKDRQNELHTILRWGEEAREERNSIFSRRGDKKQDNAI
jgi:hypothetical protein